MQGLRLGRLALTLAATIALAAGEASAAPPTNFDERAESLLKTFGVPGMSVSIVENGEPVLAKGYGVRRLGASDLVGADTNFPLASVSKAFTAAALAVLVDEGKISWDDKVADHLPGFQLYDPLASSELTVRDLLVHRSGLGLGAGDLLFYPRSSLTRAETVKRLRYLKPATSFRSGYAYDNVLYIVAGQLIETVSGQTWESFVHQRLLAPAGMRTATTEAAIRLQTSDRAWPHARLGGGAIGLGNQTALDERDAALSVNASPAGGVGASARDMSRWLTVQLRHGQSLGGAKLFSSGRGAEMWTSQTLMPILASDAPPAAQPQFLTYALGWKVSDYRGRKIIWHTGALMGFKGVAVLVPELNTGFSININSEDGALVSGLMYELLDHYLAPAEPGRDWPAVWAEFRRSQTLEALRSVADAAPVRGEPALPLARYVGTYADPWYGPISIVQTGGRLEIDFRQSPGMIGELQPWRRDTFLTCWRDKTIEPALVSFALDADGKVQRITMRAASPLADFSYDYQDLDFRPVAP